MTEPPNPLDVIGPLLPLRASDSHIRDCSDEHVADCYSEEGGRNQHAIAAAIASILNAAPAQAAENERLKEQHDTAITDGADRIQEISAENDALRNEARRLRADNAKLREALAWYEKQAAGCREITSARYARNALDRDGGARAARVLAETEPK